MTHGVTPDAKSVIYMWHLIQREPVDSIFTFEAMSNATL
jgi:hypothetical protein